MPKISIGVTTYNRKDYLRESLQSLLAQTFEDYEIIVVDDGSSDGTGELMRREFTHPRIRYFYKENGGDASAKNFAAAQALGEFLVYNDSDDLFLPDALEKLYEPLKKDPHGCSYGHYLKIDCDGTPEPTRRKVAHDPSGMILPELLQHIIVSNCGCLMPLAEFRKIGGYDTSMRVSYDYKFILEMALTHPFYAVNAPVFLRRRHAGNISGVGYAKIAVIEQLIREFAAAHQGEPGVDPAIVRRRLARLHEQLAREARHEKRDPAIVRDHLTAALKLDFSLKSLWRRCFWR